MHSHTHTMVLTKKLNLDALQNGKIAWKRKRQKEKKNIYIYKKSQNKKKILPKSTTLYGLVYETEGSFIDLISSCFMGCRCITETIFYHFSDGCFCFIIGKLLQIDVYKIIQRKSRRRRRKKKNETQTPHIYLWSTWALNKQYHPFQ